MKSLHLCLFLFITGTVTGARAPDIYFCSNYTDQGGPIGASGTWNLGTNGGFVYILFSNHNRTIKSKSLIAHIMKQAGGNYRNYENRAIKIQGNKTWAALDYQFTEPGTYEVAIQDNGGKELAKGYLTVKIRTADDEKATAQPSIDQPVIKDPDKGYYKAKTIFCKSVINGMPMDTGFVFVAGEVNVVIKNNRPLASDSIIIDVFKKGYETEKYPIYITTKNIGINGSLKETSFSLNFDQTGQYKIVSYNRRSQAISEGYVTIR